MRRGAIIGIAAGAALIATIGIVAAVWSTTRPPSADAVAERYLRALEAGDADTVAALLADPADAQIATRAFGGAVSYLSDYTFDTSEQTPGTVAVEADVRLDGESVAVRFELDQTSSGWKVARGHTTPLTATTTLGDAVLIGGELVDAGIAVALLPATYPVTASPSAFLDGEVAVAVAGEDPVTAEIAASVSDDTAGAAQAHLDAYIDTCVETAAAVPEHCGLRVPWAADLATLDEISFRVEAQPVLTLDGTGGTFTAGAGSIVATATGTDRAGENAVFRYRAADWTLRGGVDFTGDDMVLSVD